MEKRYCTLAEQPIYTELIEHWTRDSDADGEEMGNVIEQLANNIHYLKSKVNHVILVPLMAEKWVGVTAPYVQTVEIEGVTAKDNPMLVSVLEDGAAAETQKAYNKAFGLIASGTGITEDGKVTFKVYKKPIVDITVGLKGVWD